MATDQRVHGDVSACLQYCEQAMGQLRSAIDQAPAEPVRRTLEQARQALQQCINQCRESLQRV